MKTYDFKHYSVIFADTLIEGWAPGTAVTVSPEGPGFTDQVGTDGNVVRERSNDRRVTVTFALMQTSESNDFLSDLYLADRELLNGRGPASLRIVDRFGSTVFEAAKAWIQKDPEATLDATATEREWEIRVAEMRPFHGSVRDD